MRFRKKRAMVFVDLRQNRLHKNILIIFALIVAYDKKVDAHYSSMECDKHSQGMAVNHGTFFLSHLVILVSFLALASFVLFPKFDPEQYGILEQGHGYKEDTHEEPQIQCSQVSCLKLKFLIELCLMQFIT